MYTIIPSKECMFEIAGERDANTHDITAVFLSEAAFEAVASQKRKITDCRLYFFGCFSYSRLRLSFVRPRTTRQFLCENLGLNDTKKLGINTVMCRLILMSLLLLFFSQITLALVSAHSCSLFWMFFIHVIKNKQTKTMISCYNVAVLQS